PRTRKAVQRRSTQPAISRYQTGAVRSRINAVPSNPGQPALASQEEVSLHEAVASIAPAPEYLEGGTSRAPYAGTQRCGIRLLLHDGAVRQVSQGAARSHELLC